MKTLLRIVLILAVAIAPSCLEIEEEISLNKDGSGNYSMVIDMSDMMEMLQGMMGGDSEAMDQAGLGKLDSTMQASADRLRAVDGISKVKHSVEGFRMTIGYEFASVEALNSAQGQSESLTALGGGLDPMSSGEEENYMLAKRTFSRAGAPISDLMDGMEEEEASSLEMMKMFLGEAQYKMTYRMPGKVKSTTNELSEVQEDGKTVITVVPLLDWMEGNADIGNEIKFKKR
ncbi:MAG: hypothetical protein AAFP02_15695 [Bacteroidota bacterium]